MLICYPGHEEHRRQPYPDFEVKISVHAGFATSADGHEISITGRFTYPAFLKGRTPDSAKQIPGTVRSGSITRSTIFIRIQEVVQPLDEQKIRKYSS
ncbi:MAG: hypothetical protein M0Q91_18015 [Methanoregula sp.]|nr:hypothetical protein [Methanoregula sp.]